MVAMGIQGSNGQGLNSEVWTNQKPPSLDSFFAGTSNFFFAFGACKCVHLHVCACVCMCVRWAYLHTGCPVHAHHRTSPTVPAV